MHYLYLITRDDGEKYVGVSIHPDKRAYEHKFGKGSIYLKHRDFVMEVIAEGSYEYIYGLEETAIQAFNATLNIAKGGIGGMVGSRNGRSKLKEDQVSLIKELAFNGVPHVKLAEQFGVSRQTIGGIANGTNWKSVAGPISYNRRIVTEEERDMLKELKRTGLSCTEIAKQTGIKFATVYSHVREIE